MGVNYLARNLHTSKMDGQGKNNVLADLTNKRIYGERSMKKSRLLGAICACITFISTSVSAVTINDFTDGYAVGNWTSITQGDSSIDTSGAPSSISLTSSNDVSGLANTDFTIAALGDGTVSFDWSYVSVDFNPDFDPFGYLLNGTFIQVTDDGGSLSQSGFVSFAVLTGQVFGFRQLSTDSDFGAATTTVSDFSAPSAIPVPAAVWLFGSGLIGLVGIARRKKTA